MDIHALGQGSDLEIGSVLPCIKKAAEIDFFNFYIFLTHPNIVQSYCMSQPHQKRALDEEEHFFLLMCRVCMHICKKKNSMDTNSIQRWR